MTLLEEVVIYLGATVLAVPLFSRLGLGSVIGYMGAGLIIGPGVLGLISDVENIFTFAEFGVVLLLFLIGLELQLPRLWALRRPILGLGGGQMVITGGLITGIALAFGLDLRSAIITGLVLGLSSTAVAIQMLTERNQLSTRFGRVAFSILLFQDIAAIPMLAIIPLLAQIESSSVQQLAPLAIVFAVGMVVVVVVCGHFLVNPFLKLIAATGLPELFTIAALFVVVGTATLMEVAGLSMALGAFLAGVLLADSQYRHALAADIEPFKGLFMGLFFLAIGMSVDLELLLSKTELVIGLTVGLMLVKGGVLFGLGKLARLRSGGLMRLTIILSQGGEFAFVLFLIARDAHVFAPGLSDVLIVVVTLSMTLTPVIFAAAEAIRERLPGERAQPEFDHIEAQHNRVIIAGFGRVGQMVARSLVARHIPFTALDISSRQIDIVRRFGNKIYYGDPQRLPVLRAAGADQAEVLMVAIDDVSTSIAVAGLAKQHFPNLTVIARARDRDHAYKLIQIGADRIVRETFAGSLEMTSHVLRGLGMSSVEAHETIQKFRQHDESLLYEQAHMDEDGAIMARSREASAELANLFDKDDKFE
jgi:monovalent cation:proton antiporter-2 (CPA2) family protein